MEAQNKTNAESTSPAIDSTHPGFKKRKASEIYDSDTAGDSQPRKERPSSNEVGTKTGRSKQARRTENANAVDTSLESLDDDDRDHEMEWEFEAAQNTSTDSVTSNE